MLCIICWNPFSSLVITIYLNAVIDYFSFMHHPISTLPHHFVCVHSNSSMALHLFNRNSNFDSVRFISMNLFASCANYSFLFWKKKKIFQIEIVLMLSSKNKTTQKHLFHYTKAFNATKTYISSTFDWNREATIEIICFNILLIAKFQEKKGPQFNFLMILP